MNNSAVAATSLPPPDQRAAINHLMLLDETADEFTFQTFDDSPRKDRSLARILHGSIIDKWDDLVALNRAGAGVFVTVNETNLKGRTGSDITRIRALWQEDDGEGKPLPLEPHITIESSPGKYHRYLLVDGLGVDEFDAVEAAIVTDYGSDPNAKDISRVLRLAGFYHQKGKPHMVRLVEHSGGLPYARETVLKAFPPKPKGESKGEDRTPENGLCVAPKVVADLRSALNYLRADDRDLWVAVGHSLKELGDVGRGLWLDWSASSLSHDPINDPQQWETFKADRTGYQSVFKKAQDAGWVNPASNTAQGSTEADRDTDTQGAVLQEVDISDLASADIDPPSFVISPIVPRGYTTLFGGHGGSGKSILGLVWCAHVACGRNWGLFGIRQGKALFLSMEDPADLIRYRLRRICEDYELPFHFVRQNMRIIDGTESSALAIETNNHGTRSLMRTAIADRVEELADGFDLVTVDNASDAFEGNENERRQVRQFIRQLTAMVRKHDGAVLLLAHIDKNAARFGSGGNSYSGSTAWHNSTRSRLALVEGELVHEKLNVGKRYEDPVPVTWTERGVLVPDLDGTGKEAAEAVIQSSDDEAVLICLRAAKAACVSVSTATSGPATAWHTLSDFAEFPEGMKDKAGRKRFRESLVRLARSCRIRPIEHCDQHRNRRERWEIVGDE